MTKLLFSEAAMETVHEGGRNYPANVVKLWLTDLPAGAAEAAFKQARDEANAELAAAADAWVKGSKLLALWRQRSAALAEDRKRQDQLALQAEGLKRAVEADLEAGRDPSGNELRLMNTTPTLAAANNRLEVHGRMLAEAKTAAQAELRQALEEARRRIASTGKENLTAQRDQLTAQLCEAVGELWPEAQAANAAAQGFAQADSIDPHYENALAQGPAD
jgi:hypothetical protein